jgi:hypothetical protein
MDKVEIHRDLCTEMHALYERKNADYGDSFSQLRKRYPNFVCMRLFDKLNRLDTIIQPGYECKVSDEKIEDTLMDIANYAIMELTERRAERPHGGTDGQGGPYCDYTNTGCGGIGRTTLMGGTN